MAVSRVSRRCLHSSAPRYGGSPLFALASLSNARETQHLAKLSRLSRVQHSPTLQLIQSSEVLPFAPPSSLSIPAQPLTEQTELVAATETPARVEGEQDPREPQESELLSVGRAILAEKNTEIAQLRGALAEEKDRAEKRELSYALARAKTRERINRLDHDLSSAKVWKWFLLTVGVSLAAWTYVVESERPAYKYGLPKGRNAALVSEATVNPIQTPAPQLVMPVVELEPRQQAITPQQLITPTQQQASPPLVKSSSWPSIFWAS